MAGFQVFGLSTFEYLPHSFTNFPQIIERRALYKCRFIFYQRFDIQHRNWIVRRGKWNRNDRQSAIFLQKNSITVIPVNCVHASHIPMKIGEKGSVWKFIFVSPEKEGISYEDFCGFLTDNSELITLFHLMYNELEHKPHNYKVVFQSLLSIF